MHNNDTIHDKFSVVIRPLSNGVSLEFNTLNAADGHPQAEPYDKAIKFAIKIHIRLHFESMRMYESTIFIPITTNSTSASIH